MLLKSPPVVGWVGALPKRLVLLKTFPPKPKAVAGPPKRLLPENTEEAPVAGVAA